MIKLLTKCKDTWTEYCEAINKVTTLTHGRIVVEETK